MLDKNDVRDVILKECDICVHLFEKLPPHALEYRPTSDQRSTLELLRYIAHAGIGGTRAMLEGNWSGYQECAEAVGRMPAEEFPAAMERQKRQVIDVFERISETQFNQQEAIEPTGERAPLGRALLDVPLRWMVGYRMQLFLYAKASGNKEISTSNCWAGIDWPRK